VLTQVLNVATIPEHAAVRSYYDFETISEYRLGSSFTSQYKFPYLFIHRGDLHAILLAEVTRLGTQVRLSHTVVSIDTAAPSVTLENGDAITGDLVIGADGEKSVCRELILGKPTLQKTSGYDIICTTIPISAVEEKMYRHLVYPPCVTLVIVPDGHTVTYPLEQTDYFTFYES
jgi:salicylate hydroxylase